MGDAFVVEIDARITDGPRPNSLTESRRQDSPLGDVGELVCGG